MRLLQAPLDTCLDSPFFAGLSVHGLHFTVYALSSIHFRKFVAGVSRYTPENKEISAFIEEFGRQCIKVSSTRCYQQNSRTSQADRVMFYPHNADKKSLMSSKVFAVILGPDMAAPILWVPGIFGSFCRKTLHAHKVPRLRGGGGLGFGGGGGSANFILWSRGLF